MLLLHSLTRLDIRPHTGLIPRVLRSASALDPSGLFLIHLIQSRELPLMPELLRLKLIRFLPMRTISAGGALPALIVGRSVP